MSAMASVDPLPDFFLLPCHPLQRHVRSEAIDNAPHLWVGSDSLNANS